MGNWEFISRRDRSALFRGVGAVGVSFVVAACASAAGTPEQRADSNGQIPNPSINEFYLGTLGSGASQQGFISGAVAGAKASVSWYKYVSDGVTPVVFDQFGSNYGFGGGGSFSGGNNGELVLYKPDGTVVASNEAPRAPARGDSTLLPTPGPGDPPLGVARWRQSDDPRLPAGRYSGGSYFGSNTYNLSQLAFVKHPQANPTGVASADWDEAGILPAGEYFLAVTGFSTYFSGIAKDATMITQWGATYPNADGPVTPTTPFGIVTFHANSGIYQINARKAGDMDLDGDIDLDDRAALHAQIVAYQSTGGLPPSAFENGDVVNGAFLGFSADLGSPSTELARFDLTANHRIDKFDQLQWSRWTGLAASLLGDTDLDDDVDFDDLLALAKNYNRTDGREWQDGDFDFTGTVNFDDLLALAKNYGKGTHSAADFGYAFAQLDLQTQASLGGEGIVSLVPEPAVGLAAGSAMMLIRRRQRMPK